MSPPVVLLGPQRLRPTLVEAVEELGIAGGIAAITAGWEEREDEIDELRAHLGRRVVNLQLHRRTEQIFVRDREFFVAYRERRVRLRELQDVYRRRLASTLDAAIDVLRREGDPEVLDPEREDALEAVRRLDARHLVRTAEIAAEFEAEWRPGEREEIARHRAEVRALVADCEALAIAGGNVAVLVNRLRLHGIDALVRTTPVLAWSAGAMAMTATIVTYHDNPPQGPGYPEVFGAGLARVAGVLALPHAHRRLRLEDRFRVSLFARRFAPLDPLAFDDGAHLHCTGPRCSRVEAVRRLTPEGDVLEEAA